MGQPGTAHLSVWVLPGRGMTAPAGFESGSQALVGAPRRVSRPLSDQTLPAHRELRPAASRGFGA